MFDWLLIDIDTEFGCCCIDATDDDEGEDEEIDEEEDEGEDDDDDDEGDDDDETTETDGICGEDWGINDDEDESSFLACCCGLTMASIPWIPMTTSNNDDINSDLFILFLVFFFSISLI